MPAPWTVYFCSIVPWLLQIHNSLCSDHHLLIHLTEGRQPHFSQGTSEVVRGEGFIFYFLKQQSWKVTGYTWPVPIWYGDPHTKTGSNFLTFLLKSCGYEISSKREHNAQFSSFLHSFFPHSSYTGTVTSCLPFTVTHNNNNHHHHNINSGHLQSISHWQGRAHVLYTINKMHT